MKLIRTLHAWAGAILALLLLVLGLSGSLLVLREDWVRLTVPEARASLSPDPATLGAAAEAVERSLGGEVRTLAFGRPDFAVHRVYIDEHGQAYAAADGRIIARWEGAGRPEAFVFELHHYLLAGETGMTVAGVAALAGAVLVITGVIVWAPAWRSFRGRVWPRSVRRKDLVASHRDLGMIFALPVFVFCLTGGAIVFNETTKAWLEAMLPGGAPPPPKPKAGVGDVDWPRALAAAQSRFPDATLRMASWPGEAGAPVSIRLRRPGEWHPNGRTVVTVDPATSAVLTASDAQALGQGTRIYNGLYPVHAASVGGRLYDLVTFLSGLALAALGGVGLWSFLVKPRRTGRKRARESGPAWNGASAGE
jgi:uncharacterized iron-regulated membrane protein